jgi:hypothetical protein
MPDPAATADKIPTETIRPDRKPDAAKPAKLSYDDMVSRWTARGYPKPAAQGIADNMMRESKGDPSIVGDGGTSRGLFQHHAERKAALEAEAKKQGKSPDDPDLQIAFADQELKRDYPTLQKQLMAGTDRGAAEDSFKRVFERPASVMWQNKPGGGGPTLASDRFRWSDYALDEHKDRPNTDVRMMAPQDYLDLTPDLEGAPFKSPSGRSLVKSVNDGDEIQSIPSLDMRVSGNTGTVTDQDGRHRALLAQQEGLDAIPVAVKKTGQAEGGGEPTEIQGMDGTILPHTFPKADTVPKSLFRQAVDAVIPSAEAAEPPKGLIPVEGNPFAKKSAATPSPKGLIPVQGNPFAKQQDQQPADNMAVSGLKGVAAGVGKTILGGQELLGKGLEAVSDLVSPPQPTLSGLVTGEQPKRAMVGRAGEWLVGDARKGLKTIDDETAADTKAHPWATGAGELIGGMAIPGGIAGKLVRPANALRYAAASGGLAGLLTPNSGDGADYWTDKALQTGGGAAAGAAAGKAGNALAGAVAPALRATVGTLMREGVELTPGQMAGGVMKRLEDTMASIPVLGSAIRRAQVRSVQTFNRAAINRSLEDINSQLPQGLDSGHDAIGFAEQQFRAAYNQVVPSMRGVRDPVFMRNLNDIITRAHAPGTPTELPQEYIDRLRFAIQNEIVSRFDANGHISGDLAQNVGTRLDELIGPMIRSDNPYTQKIGYALRQADNAVDDMMRAHNPALQAAKDRIDAGWAKFKTVQRASAAAGAHPDGTFTPAQLSRSVLARDRSKDKAAFARGDAMMQDLSSAARDVLPQTVPDSGTPERAMLMAGIGGAAHFEPHTAALMGVGALPYFGPVNRLTNTMVNRLAQQPGPTRNALAQMLRHSGRLAAPAAGSLAANEIPTMTVHPGGAQ